MGRGFLRCSSEAMNGHAAIDLTLGTEAIELRHDAQVITLPGAATGPDELAAMSLAPCVPARAFERDVIRRRMLAFADVLAMSVAMLAVHGRFGVDLGTYAALAAVPLLVISLKLAGLYNADEVSLAHS